MSKKSYLVNCYTCEHNGQETCKGCRVLLDGDDEPYNNWQLREDLETKDQKIAELEQQLAEKDKEQNQKAIEQLEKVKDIILNERKITSFKFDIFNKGKDTALYWLNKQIDQQINELKGKVEDVKD